MAFCRIETSILNHPKFLPLFQRSVRGNSGLAAFGLWALGLAYSMDQLTDGRVMKAWTRQVLHPNIADRSAEQLVNIGLWEDCGDHYLIHDYLDWNPASHQIKADRQAARDRMRQRRSGSPGSPERKSVFGSTQNAVRPQDVEVDKTKNRPPRTGSVVQANSKQNRDPSPWPDHDPSLDPKLAAFAAAFADRFNAAAPASFRADVVRAAPTWPSRQLPPFASLLWFRDGEWHPGPA